jgi:arylsulfatase A-like enzyme
MFALYPDPPAPVPLAVPTAMPYAAWHSCLSNNPSPSHYSNWGNFTDIPNAMTLQQPMNANSAARLRRGYAASVSYTDRNVGTVMDALDATGLANATVVILIGDHGWSLGEQNT